MRFTLVYDGALPAQTSHDGRVEVKHRIRTAFHDQLAELWKERRCLSRPLAYCRENKTDWEELLKPVEGDSPSAKYRQQMKRLDLEGTMANRGIVMPFQRGAFQFLPLATKWWDLVCELDILFLRAEPPGALFPNGAGDLDNRLKVLFDALRLPELGELPPTAQPDATQDPFFVLMEDDKLITAVRVETERLLDDSLGGNRVKLIVRVTVKARRINMVTMELEGD